MDLLIRDEIASLLAAVDEIRLLADADLILRRAIELARDRIGLKRAEIFVLDHARNLMLGTWGMDLSGAVLDEHHVAHDLGASDLEALRRSAHAGAHFTVFEDCPIVEHGATGSRIAGRGWVAKTPIRSAHATIGLLVNDGGSSGEPVDELKQAHTAVFCAMLGTILDPARGWLARLAPPAASRSQRLVASAVELLEQNPGMGGKQLAGKLKISVSRLARVFKRLMGMSLVEYRNRIRLDRFEAVLDRGRGNLLEAALQAGFGSYAQFHRVFRARVHLSPREYLRPASAAGRLSAVDRFRP